MFKLRLFKLDLRYMSQKSGWNFFRKRSCNRFVIENVIKTSFHPSLGLSSTFNLCGKTNSGRKEQFVGKSALLCHSVFNEMDSGKTKTANLGSVLSLYIKNPMLSRMNSSSFLRLVVAVSRHLRGP